MNIVKIIREIEKGYFETYSLESPRSFTIDIDSKDKTIIFCTDFFDIRVGVSQFSKGTKFTELIKKIDNAITNLFESKRIVSENEIIKMIKDMI